MSLTDVAVESTVYHDVNLDALTETKSYFDLDDLNDYYSHCETEEGGLFPVGQNGIWHGGVHEPECSSGSSAANQLYGQSFICFFPLHALGSYP